jgi:signal transduction histidine kinase/CheY-like chemotaxis protein/AraC-like DNA-binding protein/sugar lactone lactonase YvrE
MLIFLVLLPLLAAEASGQAYRLSVRRYGIEEGLPHRQVNYIIQDRQGFIWGATNGGVFRFDGRRFKIYTKSDNGLTGDLADWVAEDADGNIWVCRIGPNAWIDILNPVTGVVTHSADFFKNKPIPVSLTGAVPSPPNRLSDGTLVFGHMEKRGWLTYHPARGWQQIVIPDCQSFYLFKATDQHTVWGVALAEGPNNNCLVEMDTTGKLLHRFEPPPEHHFLYVQGASSGSNFFYVMEAGQTGLKYWEIHLDGTEIELSIPNPATPPYNYSRLENDAIQLQFPGFYDKEGHLLLDLKTQFPELDEPQFREFFQDKNGNNWFATTFGLLVVEVHRDHFTRLLYDPNAPGGRGIACRGLLEKNGQLFVNAEQLLTGRRMVDLKTGTVSHLPGGWSLGIGESADGNIWTDLGLDVWTKTSFAKSTPDGALIGQRYSFQRMWGGVWNFFEENPQRLLMVHLDGISVFNPQTGAWAPWQPAPEYPEFDKAYISYIGRDRSGRIWACADQGLYELKPGGGVMGRYWSGGLGDHYLPYNHILHFYQDAAGVFWIGTSGGGLIRWDGHQSTQILRKDGLLNNVVYAVYEDRNNHLWMPTDYGIVQFDKNSLRVRRTWLTTDGITNNEFNRVSHCRGADGTLYFGGLNGVTAFNPDQFYEQQPNGANGKKLVVSDLKILSGDTHQLETRMADLVRSSEITVQPGDRYLQLEFALLDFIGQEKVNYTWKMEGTGGDWESLKEPVLRLSGLSSGAHQLRIRAQAADGTMAANEINIQLKVLPPVYLRWWFLLLALISVIVGVRMWLYWRERKHRMEQERLEAEVQRQTATIRSQTVELKRLDEAKSRFFANVSHELRTPLTLILGPIGSLIKGKRLQAQDHAYATIAHQHGNHLLRLVNEILDLSKLESAKMVLHESPIMLQQFIRRVVSAFESHAELLEIRFVYEYRAPARLKIMADEDKLQKVFNNLLSNALKFTPPHAGGGVNIRVEQIDNNIRVGVHDTGRGIHPDDLPHIFERFFQTAQRNAPIEGGTGIGLALCREFANLMQGKIWVESELGAGSHFYFEFPVSEVMGTGEPAPAEIPEPDIATDLPQRPLPALMQDDQQAPARILLVEDNDSMRSYIKSILSGRYEVSGQENGSMALKMIDNIQPQLIISDIMMPVMDGFQLLDQLKSDDRWRHIPVIMLTARADIRDKLRALRIGVDDYLLKPFEEEELLIRVENLLRNYRSRAETEDPAVSGELPDPALPEHTAQLKSGATAEDLEWLAKLEKEVRDMIGDSRLNADWLTTKMYVGRSIFFKRVKTLTGLTPNEYVQTVRMTCARELLETRACRTVKEASYAVGLRDVKYFSEQFSKYFGKLPSSYL